MVSAYSAASSGVTPRATTLLMDDSTTQNPLATSIGSFSFSLVGIIALSTGAYGEQGRVVLFTVTIGVVILIVYTLLRWIDHLSKLGRVGETIDYISLAQGSGNRFLIDQALANRDSRPRSFCEVKHVPALVSLVEAGLGVGVVPKLAMPAKGHATPITRPLKNPSISRTLGLISRRGRALSPVAQLLFDLLMEIRE